MSKRKRRMVPASPGTGPVPSDLELDASEEEIEEEAIGDIPIVDDSMEFEADVVADPFPEAVTGKLLVDVNEVNKHSFAPIRNETGHVLCRFNGPGGWIQNGQNYRAGEEFYVAMVDATEHQDKFTLIYKTI